MESLILTEVRDNVGILTLNRPRQFNSLSLPMLGQLVEALAALERDPLVRCALIQAEGKHFCTGADLDEVQALRGSVEALEHFLATGLAAFRRLEQSPLPVVAAVQGLALAGGLELVLACDIVWAADSARLGDQHAQFTHEQHHQQGQGIAGGGRHGPGIEQCAQQDEASAGGDPRK